MRGREGFASVSGAARAELEGAAGLAGGVATCRVEAADEMWFLQCTYRTELR